MRIRPSESEQRTLPDPRLEPLSDAAGVEGRMDEVRNAEVTPRRAEMRRVGDATRRVIARLVATKATEEELRVAADALEEIAATLEKYPQGRLYEGFAESANAGDPHAFFDHSPVMGLANPLAPPLRLEVRDGKVHGVRAGIRMD